MTLLVVYSHAYWSLLYWCLMYMWLSLQPVNMFPPTPLGFYDVYGNVWDWVEDHFNGLPGFEVTYLYNDFSTPCFDGRHTLMMVRYWCTFVSTYYRHTREIVW